MQDVEYAGMLVAHILKRDTYDDYVTYNGIKN